MSKSQGCRPGFFWGPVPVPVQNRGWDRDRGAKYVLRTSVYVVWQKCVSMYVYRYTVYLYTLYLVHSTYYILRTFDFCTLYHVIAAQSIGARCMHYALHLQLQLAALLWYLLSVLFSVYLRQQTAIRIYKSERRERRKLEARKKQKIHFFSPVMLNIDEARSTISISRLPPLFYSIHFFSCVSVNNK